MAEASGLCLRCENLAKLGWRVGRAGTGEKKRKVSTLRISVDISGDADKELFRASRSGEIRYSWSKSYVPPLRRIHRSLLFLFSFLMVRWCH